MSGITTGIGLFSGIDTGSLINQLLALEARPRDLAQQRILQLQIQQSAYLDINSKLGAMQAAARTFRQDFIFSSMGSVSSDPSLLSATASRTATPGTYSFIIDRLVSSQQMLSKGFVDKDTTAIGATSFTFESEKGRLDRDIALADLNDGDGVKRGKLTITQGSDSATVDLSKAVTVNDVLDAINASGLDVAARVEGDHFVLSGGSAFSVSNASGYTTATSLGIAGSSTGGKIEGSTVYQMTESTTLSQLNDGNGVFIRDSFGGHDFDITVNGVTAEVNLGTIYDGEDEAEGPVSTLAGVIARIEDALRTAEINTHVSVSIVDGVIEITDSNGDDVVVTEQSNGSTAKNLGILGTGAGGTLTGERILSGLNTTLAKNLNGGSGVSGDGLVSFTDRAGVAFVADVSGATTVQEIVDTINAAAAGAGAGIVASINDIGSGLRVTDTTGATASNLIVTGDTADSLGISTDVAGVNADTVSGSSLQHKYVSMSTRVDDLNGGTGIGTGEFRVTDGDGVSFDVDIGSDTETVFDLIQEINGQASAAGANITARINDKGDGILIQETTPGGAAAIKVEDVTGKVAESLRLEGEATGVDADNFIDGSAEVTIEFEAEATLQEIAQAITDSAAGVRATVINDGTGSNPYRLNLTAANGGTDGRFIIDDGGLGLNLNTLNEGEDALVFFGSTDPANAVLLTNSANTLDAVIPGVTIDLKGVSEDPVTVTVARDTEKILTSIETFINTYNTLVDRIGFLGRYDAETETKGPLLGDTTISNLRSALARTALSKPLGVDDQFSRLTEVGVKVTDGGKLSLDREKLREAMETDFQAVADLFAAREVIPPETETEIGDGITVRTGSDEEQFSKLGVVFLFEQLAGDYLDSVDGILTTKDRTLVDQIELQKDRVEGFNELLDSKRQRLEAQFLAMERALASLQTQQSSLLSLMQNLG